LAWAVVTSDPIVGRYQTSSAFAQKVFHRFVSSAPGSHSLGDGTYTDHDLFQEQQLSRCSEIQQDITDGSVDAAQWHHRRPCKTDCCCGLPVEAKK